jgi:hypothetical protein
MGLTIVDSLSTLLLLNLTTEAATARDWIMANLDPRVVRAPSVSVRGWLRLGNWGGEAADKGRHQG